MKKTQKINLQIIHDYMQQLKAHYDSIDYKIEREQQMIAEHEENIRSLREQQNKDRRKK